MVQPIDKGVPAPYTGILFPVDLAKDLRNNVIDLDAQKQINSSLQQSLKYQLDTIDREENKIKLLSDQNDKLALRLQDQASFNTWEKLGFIGLGILASGLSFYGLKKIQTSN